MNKEQILLLNLIRNDFKMDDQWNLSEINWEEFHNLSVQQKMFPLYSEDLYSRMNNAGRKLFENTIYLQHKKIDSLIHELFHVTNLAKQNKIRFLIFKGIVLSQLIYNNIYARKVGDWDILVEDEDIVRMNYIFRKLGYIESLDGTTSIPYPILNLSYSNHVIAYRRHEAIFEVHKKIYQSSNTIQDFLWNSKEYNICDVNILTFDLEHTFIYLLYNAYADTEDILFSENTSIIRDYVDIHYFLNRYASEINMSYIQKIINKHRTQNVVGITLKNLCEVYPQHNYSYYIKEFHLDSEQNVLNWNISFIERTLDSNARANDLMKLTKRKIFSDNICNLYNVRKESDNWIDIPNQYDLSIKYKINYDCQKIIITLIIPPVLADVFENFKINFQFINNDIDYDLLYTELTMFKCNHYLATLSNKKRFVELGKTDVDESSVTAQTQNGNTVLCSSISFEKLGYNPLVTNMQMAVKVQVQKYMAPNIYHSIDNRLPNQFNALLLEYN